MPGNFLVAGSQGKSVDVGGPVSSCEANLAPAAVPLADLTVGVACPLPLFTFLLSFSFTRSFETEHSP